MCEFTPKVDLYPRRFRGAAVATGILLSFFSAFTNATPLPFPLSAGLIVVWNGLLSAYSVRQQPFVAARPRADWLGSRWDDTRRDRARDSRGN